METLIAPIDVVGKDPFGRLLARIKLKPWQAWGVSLSLFLAYTLLLPALFEVLFPRDGLERSSIEDRVNQVGFWIIHPLVIFYYVWQPTALSRLYNIVIPLAPQTMIAGLARSSRILHKASHWWVGGCLAGLFVVVLGFLFIVDFIGIRWYSINWGMTIILQISRFFLFYMIVTVIFRHLLSAVNINRVYRHITLPILVTKSRYSTAFDSITAYGFGFAGFAAVLGLFLAMRFLYSTPVIPEDLIYLIVYIFLVPFAFMLPFWQAHVNMRLSREAAIRKISNELQDEYDNLVNGLSTESDTTQNYILNRIAVLRTMLEMTEKSPTWPFENLTIFRIFAATASPFLITGFGYLFDFLIR